MQKSYKRIRNRSSQSLRWFLLALVPGVGEQKGEAGLVLKYFRRNNCIVNVGRALMFPKVSWQDAAKYYQDMFNEERDS